MREPDHTRRVVITGLGIVSPIGNDVATAWSSLTGMKSGLDRITHWDPTPYAPYVVAGEVRDFDPAAWLDPKSVRRTGPEFTGVLPPQNRHSPTLVLRSTKRIVKRSV